MRYQHHVFICANEREQGDSCGGRGSLDLLKAVKGEIRRLGLDHDGGLSANKSGCFGLCSQGPNAVVYPSGQWHRLTSAEQAVALVRDLSLDCPNNEARPASS
jgi:(2Fe-2S) ferredoxin